MCILTFSILFSINLFPFMDNSAFLQSSARNQAGSGCSFGLPTSLPPVRIILRNNVQNISTFKPQARFFAGNIRISLRLVIKVCSNSNFALPGTELILRRNYFESDCSLGILLPI